MSQVHVSLASPVNTVMYYVLDEFNTGNDNLRALLSIAPNPVFRPDPHSNSWHFTMKGKVSEVKDWLLILKELLPVTTEEVDAVISKIDAGKSTIRLKSLYRSRDGLRTLWFSDSAVRCKEPGRLVDFRTQLSQLR